MLLGQTSATFAVAAFGSTTRRVGFGGRVSRPLSRGHAPQSAGHVEATSRRFRTSRCRTSGTLRNPRGTSSNVSPLPQVPLPHVGHAPQSAGHVEHVSPLRARPLPHVGRTAIRGARRARRSGVQYRAGRTSNPRGTSSTSRASACRCRTSGTHRNPRGTSSTSRRFRTCRCRTSGTLRNPRGTSSKSRRSHVPLPHVRRRRPGKHDIVEARAAQHTVVVRGDGEPDVGRRRHADRRRSCRSA